MGRAVKVNETRSGREDRRTRKGLIYSNVIIIIFLPLMSEPLYQVKLLSALRTGTFVSYLSSFFFILVA